MSYIWSNYYDEVEYKEKTDKLDASGNIIYKSSVPLKCRHVSGGKEYVINKDDTAIKYTHEYQTPNKVKEGDMIDNREVVYVEPSKDVFGNFHFMIVRTR